MLKSCQHSQSINKKLFLNSTNLRTTIDLRTPADQKQHENQKNNTKSHTNTKSHHLENITDVSKKLKELSNGDFRRLLEKHLPKSVANKSEFCKTIKKEIAELALNHVVDKFAQELIRGYKELYVVDSQFIKDLNDNSDLEIYVGKFRQADLCNKLALQTHTDLEMIELVKLGGRDKSMNGNVLELRGRWRFYRDQVTEYLETGVVEVEGYDLNSSIDYDSQAMQLTEAEIDFDDLAPPKKRSKLDKFKIRGFQNVEHEVDATRFHDIQDLGSGIVTTIVPEKDKNKSITQNSSQTASSTTSTSPSIYKNFKKCFYENTAQGCGLAATLVNIKFRLVFVSPPTLPRNGGKTQYQNIIIEDEDSTRSVIFVYGNKAVEYFARKNLVTMRDIGLTYELHNVYFKKDNRDSEKHEFLVRDSSIDERFKLDKIDVQANVSRNFNGYNFKRYNFYFDRFLEKLDEFKYGSNEWDTKELKGYEIILRIKQFGSDFERMFYYSCQSCKTTQKLDQEIEDSETQDSDSKQKLICESCKFLNNQNPNLNVMYKCQLEMFEFPYYKGVKFNAFNICLDRLLDTKASDFISKNVNERKITLENKLIGKQVRLSKMKLKWYNSSLEIMAYYHPLIDADYKELAHDVYEQLAKELK